MSREKNQHLEQNGRAPNARIVVCVATRGRAASLVMLLNALEKIETPKDTDVAIVVVENSTGSSLQVEVRERSRPGRSFLYGLESRLGIPFARNRALRMAMAEGADYVAFIDDDEIPQCDWLVRLWEKVRAGNYDLVGGPVEPFVADSPASWVSRKVWLGLRDKSQTARRKAMHMAKEGLEQSVFVRTNNWMVRSDFVRQHGLEFDESMGFSGGTDLKFYRDLKRVGGRTGWNDAALVRENLPAGRLTLGYQYRRARDQAISNFHVRYSKITSLVFFKGLLYSLGKLVFASVTLFLLPFAGGKGLLKLVGSLGQAMGRWHAIHDRRSDHYRTVL